MLRHQEVIARQMRRYSSNPAVIEELTQTVFVNAFFGLHSYKPRAPLLHWLRTIASNVGYEHWREERRRGRFVSCNGLEERLVDTKAGENESDNKEKFDKLMGLMEELKPAERQILFLLYIDGNSIESAANCMGWNRTTTKMRAYRARNRLRAILRKSDMQSNMEGWLT